MIAGYPGFIKKVWMVNLKTGEWLGLYEWETEQYAKSYINSFVLRLMTKRVVGKNTFLKLVPKMSLSVYLNGKRN